MKLLFVDPNKTIQAMVATLFADADVEIGFAESLAAARDMATEGWQFICFAQHLPDGEGLTLCRELRAMSGYTYTPMFLFTADDTVELHTAATQAGATEVFLKKNIGDLVRFVGRYSARVKKIAGRVLYVEDTVSQALVVQAVLAQQGLTVEWCGSGDEAWACIQRREYDLLLCDVVLTGTLSGAALISRIRSLSDARGDMPIIAVTAFDHLSRRIELFHLGVSDYVAKPIVEEELASRVRNLIQRRQVERALKQQTKREYDGALLRISAALQSIGDNLEHLLKDICDQVAMAMNTPYVGIWDYVGPHADQAAMLKSRARVAPAGSPEDNLVLEQSRAPRWFDALKTERVLAISSVNAHPATQDIEGGPVFSGNLASVLAVPVGPITRRMGVLCLGSGTRRTWTTEDEGFAAAVGDLLALAFETHQRWRADQQVRLAGLVFEAAAEAILVCDRDSRIITANAAFLEMTGYVPEEIIGQTPALFHSGRHDDAFYKDMWSAIEREGSWRGEVWDRHKDGTYFPVRLSITQARNDAGQVTHYIGVSTNISRELDDQMKLQYIAYHDVLTALPNRVFAENTLADLVSKQPESTAGAGRLAVLCIDVDRFKTINSSFGHAQGDRLLKEVGNRLRAVIGGDGHLARWSGVSLIALVDREGHAAHAATLAQRCLDAFDYPVRMEDGELRVSLSVGIGLFPDHGRDAQDLVRHAVTAVNFAKENGGNRFAFFDPEMEQRTMRRLLLESRLRHAIEQKHFVLHYQPKVDATTLRPTGLEALLRWQDPVEGLIPPGQFIGLAEETGQIFPITDWVLHEACRQNAQWQRDEGLELPVAVNLPAGSFTHGDIVATVRQLLVATGLSPRLLEVELTESAAMEDPRRAIEVFREFEALGVRVGIDDFGTGYSSLAYLNRLPIDTLKIDRSFVMDIGGSDGNLVLVTSIISLARSMGLTTVAEGVERQAQGDVLRGLGCDQFQGYFYSRPQPAADIPTILRMLGERHGG